MSKYAELIARLEAATEGSKGLDREILEATVKYGAALMKAPLYTTSLDAALTLVPGGLCWNVSSADNAMVDGKPDATVFGDEVERYQPGWPDAPPDIVREPYEHHEAATPALAICIAALKARAAGE
jgi:hypothetical protein